MNRAISSGRSRTGETPTRCATSALKGLNIPARAGRRAASARGHEDAGIAGEPGFHDAERAAWRELRAYDKATGTEVGAVPMPAPQTGSPMTYMLNGRQYLAVPISGAGYSGELMVLRAPQATPAR